MVQITFATNVQSIKRIRVVRYWRYLRMIVQWW